MREGADLAVAHRSPRRDSLVNRVQNWLLHAIIGRLARMDDELMTTVIGQLDGTRARQLRAEAGEELAGFGSRMPSDARAKAVEAAFVRLVRESTGLPTIGYE